MKYIIVPTEIKGKSVFAKTSILKDELIGEYYRNYTNHIYKKNNETLIQFTKRCEYELNKIITLIHFLRINENKV